MSQLTWSQTETTSSRGLPVRAIVVGVDDTPAAREVLLWAAHECALRGVALVACRAFPLRGGPPVLDGPDPARDDAWRLARSAIDRVREQLPGVDAYACAAPGPVREALLGAVERPEMFVVGASRRSRLVSLLLQSPALQVAQTAPRPVVVVPGPAEPDDAPAARRLYAGHVVVGVDETEQSGAALAFAFAEAASRGRPLVAVHVDALQPSEAWWDQSMLELHEETQAESWILLQDKVEPFQRAYPQVRVKLVRHNVPVVSGLLRAASGAELLVVGTSGHGRIDEMIHGSVSRSLVKQAPCPVAVVPTLPPAAAGDEGES